METRATDQWEFEALVIRYQDAVCATAYAVLRDRARSEEIAQDAFLLAWQRSRAVPITAGWICGVARNLARNAARRRTEVGLPLEVVATGPDPRDALIDHQTRARARAALDRLAERDREAITLYYRCGESLDDVAGALGISREAAKQRVRRGRERLRELVTTVETSLRATRPGSAFTAAVVGAWLARGGRVEAATLTAAGAAVAWWAAGPTLRIGAAALAAATAGAFALATTWSAPEPVARPATARSAPGKAPVSVPAARTAPAPAGVRPDLRDAAQRLSRLVAAGSASTSDGEAAAMEESLGGWLKYDYPGSSSATLMVHYRLTDWPAHRVLKRLGDDLGMAIVVASDLDEPITMDVVDRPGPALLDELVHEVGGERHEVVAVELVRTDGQVAAAQLGGDPISLHVTGARVNQVLDRIEPALHMPIHRWKDRHPRHGDDEISDDLATLIDDLTLKYEPERWLPRVSIDVDGVPAGVVLEEVLRQTGLGYRLTTGYEVSMVAPAVVDGT